MSFCSPVELRQRWWAINMNGGQSSILRCLMLASVILAKEWQANVPTSDGDGDAGCCLYGQRRQLSW
jgi:hypothetical protein